MKAFIFEQPGSGSIREVEWKSPGFKEVLIKVKRCGICGTDLRIWAGTEPSARNVVLGHEYSGEVVELGSGISRVKVGDRVTVDPNIACQTCEFCLTGKVNLCSNLKALGVDIDGGFAQYCVVPETQLYPIPDYMTWDEAALVEPVACAIHGINSAEIIPGDTVLIMGGGPIGLIMLQLAKLRGASRILLSEITPSRRDFARQLGADSVIDPSNSPLADVIPPENAPDVVIECIGNPSTQAEAIRIVKRGGRVVLFGDGQLDATFPVSSYIFYYKNLTVRGAALNPYTHLPALKLLAEKKIASSPLISRIIPLEQLKDVLENGYLASDIKILVAPND